MEQRFRSKVDLWLVVPGATGAAIPGILAVGRMAEGDPYWVMNLALIAVSFALASVFLVSYTITDDAMIVRQGPLRYRMPLTRLRELRGTREASAAPALAIDRIEVRTEKGRWLLVSPSDRLGFIQAIQRRVPSIAINGL
jgi:hypothetical protein